MLRPDVGYRFDEGDQGDGVPVGLLKAGVALVFNTSNTPACREDKAFGDPLETLWRRCVFGLCGVQIVCREMYSVVVTSTAADRTRWLERVRKAVRVYFPPGGVSDGATYGGQRTGTFYTPECL